MNEFRIIIAICLSILVAMGGLYIIKAELDKFKPENKQAACSKYDMKYVYARMDICIDKNGQMWSMRDLK